MSLFYALSVRGYAFLIRIASLWNTKAKKWMVGRKEVWRKLETWSRKDKPVYWFHCASLGEFEQGRPVIEKLKSERDIQIIITFFSPSGYEIRKDYPLADLIVYLPRENTKNVKRFLGRVRPEKVFFVKYEFWATYLFEAKNRGAKLYSISAVFRSGQLFFKPYGGYMRKVLKAFDHIFVQDKKSNQLLSTIGVKSIVAGDTRYDRVMNNAKNVSSYAEIEAFIDRKKVLVIGSAWLEDDAVYMRYINQPNFDWKVIIAPHEIGENRIKAIESQLEHNCIRYGAIQTADVLEADVLIIDNIGMLMNVYQYADIAYVGGAFGKGLHNILEPACFGLPVIFGNKYDKFIEAYDFIAHGIGFPVNDQTEFAIAFDQLREVDLTFKVKEFMEERTGATQKIISHLS